MSVDKFGRYLDDQPSDKFGKSFASGGARGPPGVGFVLTDDGNFDMENKRLTNIATTPFAENDACSKLYVNDTVNKKIKATESHVLNMVNQLEKATTDDFKITKQNESGLKRLSEKCTNISKDVAQNESRLRSLSGNLKDISKKITDLEIALKNNDDRLNQLLPGFSAIMEDVKRWADDLGVERQTEMTKKLTEVEKKFSDAILEIDKKITTVAGWAVDLGDETEMTKKLTEVEKKIDDATLEINKKITAVTEVLNRKIDDKTWSNKQKVENLSNWVQHHVKES